MTRQTRIAIGGFLIVLGLSLMIVGMSKAATPRARVAITGADVRLHFRRVLYAHCGTTAGVGEAVVQVRRCAGVSIVTCHPTGYNKPKKAQWVCVGIVTEAATFEGRLVFQAGDRSGRIVAGFNPWGHQIGKTMIHWSSGTPT